MGSPSDQHDEDVVSTVVVESHATRNETRGGGAEGEEAALRAGDRVGRYRLVERLGAGGMGVVWVAHDPQLDRTVAVKVLHEQRRHRGTSTAQERLRREAHALARLSSPNVVAIYDLGMHGRRVFLAMKHVEGQTLDVWAQREPSVAQVLEVFEQAAAGLAAVHEAGFVHRDFKPTNVMIDRDGRVLVMDFGLARIHDPESVSEHDLGASSASLARDASTSFSSVLTVDGVVMGTPAYMAPEQHTGNDADARADQFAFCASLYELLLGRRPFSGRDVAELARQKHHERLDFTGARPLPRRLRALLRRGLHPDPSRRHPGMLALRDALVQLRRPPRRRGLVVASLGVTVLGSVGWAALSRSRPETCEAGTAHMAMTWNDDARAELSRSFHATGLAYADDAALRASGRLDAYASDWVEQYGQVCHAAGHDDPSLLDLRMRCLGEARASMAATVGLLVRADATTVQRAVAQVADLPPLQRCDDLDALRAEVPAPIDPAHVAAIDALRQQLEQAAALDRGGRYADGRELAEQALRAALELGYEPSIARARIRLASLQLGLGDVEAARRGLSDAALLAAGIGDHQAAADAASRLAFVLAAELDQPEEALRWARHAEASLGRLPDDPLARARLDNSFGVIYSVQADPAAALVAFERAYETKRAVLGEDHPEVTGALENMALSHGELGHLAQAEQLQRRSLSLLEKSVGPRHPDLGHSLMNLGNAVEQLGHFDEAAVHYARSLEIFREALGLRHPLVARMLGQLGHVAMTQDRLLDAEAYFRESAEIIEAIHGERHRELAWSLGDRALVTAQLGRGEEAIVLYQRARGILEAAAPDHESLAFAMMNEVSALVELGRTEEAEPLLARAAEILELRFEPDHPARAQLLSCEAELLRGQGRFEDARRKLAAALEIFTRVLGADHPDLGFTLLDLGEVEHELQLDEMAREHLRRALHLAEGSSVGEGFRAATRFALAQALWPDPAARPEALTLAQAAREGFASYGKVFQEDVDEVAGWLREHPR